MISIPTLAQLYSDIKSSIESAFNITIPSTGKNFLRTFSHVQAGKFKIFYLSLANVQKNVFADTAESELIGGTLERFGRIKLGRNPYPASAGTYSVEVTGDIGAVIPASTTFKSNDDSLSPGKLFILDSAFTLTATTDTISLRALEAGQDSKLEVGNELTVTAPIANVDNIATVTVEAVEPLAAETLEDYRTKVLDAFRLEAQGGAGADYRLWSADVQGVRKVFPYAKSGFAGEVDVFVEATTVDSTDGKGTPSALMLTDVEGVFELDPDTTKPINERGRRPLGVFQVNVQAITVKEIDIVITGYSGLSTAIENTIQSEIESQLYDIRPFVSTTDVLADANDILSVNKLIYMIQQAMPGSVFTSVSFEVDGTPTTSIQFTNGDIPHLNSITFS